MGLNLILIEELIDLVILSMQMEGKAVNVIEFSAKGLNLLNGQLTIEAAFKVVSKSVKIPIYF